jgi:hypothetical protein
MEQLAAAMRESQQLPELQAVVGLAIDRLQMAPRPPAVAVATALHAYAGGHLSCRMRRARDPSALITRH